MVTSYQTVLDQEELIIDRINEPGWSASSSPLSDIAKTIAPQFCEAVLASLGRSKMVLNLPECDLESLRSELQHWFIALFKPWNADVQDVYKYKTHPQRNHFQLPLSFLLRNLEIILRYGREVTALSPQSEQSLRRFIHSLSDELAKRQVDVEQRLEYVSDLLLLD